MRRVYHFRPVPRDLFKHILPLFLSALALLFGVTPCRASQEPPPPEPNQQQAAPASDSGGIVQLQTGLPISSEGDMEILGDQTVEIRDPAKRGELAVAPIPFFNPTIGSGIGVGGIYAFRLDPQDTISPPSTTMGGGFYTSSKSWGLGGAQKFYLWEDRVRGLVGASMGEDA